MCCSGLYDVEGYERLGSLISNTLFFFFHTNKLKKLADKKKWGGLRRHTQCTTSIIVSDPMCIFSWSNCERFGPRFSGHCFMGKNEFQNKILTAWQCFLSVRRSDR